LDNRTITISDVAMLVGVSKSTVSRVLSGSKTQIPISQETQDRVREAALELGYRPHPGARALSGKNTYLLGLIVREVNDPFFADLIDIISDAATEEGYDLVLGNAKRDLEEALKLRDMMLDMRYCDGLLLCGDLRESEEDHGFLSRMGTHHSVVSVSRGSKHLVDSMPSVTVDNREGVHLALNYLTKLGHRRIASMDAGRMGDLWERVETYRSFMQDRFGGVPEGYVIKAENSFAGGYEAASQLLKLPSPPTAILALDDVMALGVLAAVRDLALDVPGDVSIIGFDDAPWSPYVRPALTTVSQPIEEIGRKALDLLLGLIDRGDCAGPCPQLRLAPSLVVRDSCAAPRTESSAGEGR
jgi:DNA-binding LacI/PurR family transcriptional regulator